MMLNVVLLPAPLGPMTPRISFSRTSKSRLDTASRPPNRLLRPLSSRTADGIVNPDQSLRCRENRGEDQHAEQQHMGVADERRQEKRQQEQQHGADSRPGVP